MLVGRPDGAALGAGIGAPVQFGAEFVDDLGVDGNVPAEPVVVLPQCAGGGFGVYCAGVQMWERGRDGVRLGLSAGECVRTQRLTPASAASCSVASAPVDRLDGRRAAAASLR
jgi:hypothetical protein